MALPIIRKFFKDCQNMINIEKYTPAEIINMDETSIYLDFPSNYTYDIKGSKRVSCTTTGNERTRLSAGFSATASGVKLATIIVVPRKKELPDYTPPDDIVLIYKTGGTFNDDVICTYIEKVVQSYMDSANLSKVCLIIDSARCHKTVKVRDKCRELNIKHFLIPPRLTGLLQPADVCWFASLKKTYHKLWTDWFLNGVKTFTIKNQLIIIIIILNSLNQLVIIILNRLNQLIIIIILILLNHVIILLKFIFKFIMPTSTNASFYTNITMGIKTGADSA